MRAHAPLMLGAAPRWRPQRRARRWAYGGAESQSGRRPAVPGLGETAAGGGVLGEQTADALLVRRSAEGALTISALVQDGSVNPAALCRAVREGGTVALRDSPQSPSTLYTVLRIIPERNAAALTPVSGYPEHVVEAPLSDLHTALPEVTIGPCKTFADPVLAAAVRVALPGSSEAEIVTFHRIATEVNVGDWPTGVLFWQEAAQSGRMPWVKEQQLVASSVEVRGDVGDVYPIVVPQKDLYTPAQSEALPVIKSMFLSGKAHAMAGSSTALAFAVFFYLFGALWVKASTPCVGERVDWDKW
eukprot:TRINITY_DN29547_c0_g1_i1.p2 TRINITY_DN29547_c0_g1~~TRINITY_DN29547_c0_g1_i1.p2  ORF type:complete len:302 (+),score=55.17 TRINITY_DN29547_c0_g1_i1:100-1005(+)